MKTLLTLSAYLSFLVWSSSGSEATGESATFVPSTVQSNIFVVFQSSPAEKSRSAMNRPITFPTRAAIAVGFGSKTNQIYEIFRLAPEYGYRIEAKSESGEIVEPKRMGKRFGGKYDSVRAYDEKYLDWSGRYYQPDGKSSYTVRHAYGGGRPFLAIASQDGVTSLQPVLPPLQDLFNFDKPGNYTVSVEFQCFARPYHAASTQIYLVKFPKVEFQAVKEEITE